MALTKADVSNAKQKFKDFVTKNFDLQNDKISSKMEHSLKTQKIIRQITSSLNLNKNDALLAEIIALFHDFGRFEQVKSFDTFSDIISIDHGDFGADALFLKNQIEDFVTLSCKEKHLAEIAIRAHNKYEIPKNLNSREKLFCKLIRDADKVDIMRIFSIREKTFDAKHCKLKKNILKNFYNCKCYFRQKKENFFDRIILIISFIFDINFKKTYEIIYENDYINLFKYNLLLHTDFKIDDEILKCFDFANNFLKSQIGEKNAGTEKYL